LHGGHFARLFGDLHGTATIIRYPNTPIEIRSNIRRLSGKDEDDKSSNPIIPSVEVVEEGEKTEHVGPQSALEDLEDSVEEVIVSEDEVEEK
jgi:hypothetical protein